MVPAGTAWLQVPYTLDRWEGVVYCQIFFTISGETGKPYLFSKHVRLPMLSVVYKNVMYDYLKMSINILTSSSRIFFALRFVRTENGE